MKNYLKASLDNNQVILLSGETHFTQERYSFMERHYFKTDKNRLFGILFQLLRKYVGVDIL